ncbi:structural maintenance of chromosomes protein 6B [Carex littledalei]|uniref:Structural maintenance of chromosomes protein 6B n=1 Tax=Carex littledalei TaxID=544730 RepID=A0A833VJT2_9POAL|nr:structural maintenance of chromosomes protein 6B [Carex littledalei]
MATRHGAGIISKIKVENFMCHSSLQIELGDWVNFITGQNGSGKSAILTALCVAFGCRAKGTQRASSLKDFIKTGCSYAAVFVEIKNRGEDAFKHEVYGDTIIIERRITESTSSTTLKDSQGKKVSQRKDELRELVEHFNIDVENPCVIMTQDKSREFLHSGNDKDKFKFFFKATLLQQVSELLDSIRSQLVSADSIVQELEASIRPMLRELDELREKIKNMEHVEEIAQELQVLKKKLAWSWVYDVDRQITEQALKIEKLKERVPACQEKIDRKSALLEELKARLLEQKSQVASLIEKASGLKVARNALQQNISSATEEKLELEEEYARGVSMVKKMASRLKTLERQIQDVHEQHVQNTQAEESAIKENMKKYQDEIEAARLSVERMKDEEHALSESLRNIVSTIDEMSKEIDENKRLYNDLCSQARELQQRQTNKVTAFGGDKVLRLLRSIESHHLKFQRPPIGPIGAHVKLVGDDFWALAVDIAIGKILDAFIVTSHKDSLVLRDCAREANYRNLQIIIYDFSRPRLNIPLHMLPATDHPTTLKVIQSDNPTVLNVLVDMAGAERQVLVQDYEVGKSVAFEQRVKNLKEVYTSDGYKLHCRGSVETILNPDKWRRTGRLCSSLDDRINDVSEEASRKQKLIQEVIGKKRRGDEERRKLESRVHSLKKRRLNEDHELARKEDALRDMENDFAAETKHDPVPDVDEIYEEIAQVQEDKHSRELPLEKVKVRISITTKELNDLKSKFKDLHESIDGVVKSIELAEHEISSTEENLRSAEDEKIHYEGLMEKKVLPDIKLAESEYEELKGTRQENYGKASIICSESEVKELGGCDGFNPEQLSAQINRLKQRLQKETSRFTELIDDLRAMQIRKENKVLKKQQMYGAFREKLNACQKALDLRWNKFQRNASLLKRQLTWQFNGHLRKKGISGHIKVDYEKKLLSVEVKMPQDASGNTVRDTRGLSGGERSFSTLCFALALHEMTEAPFRAMDEFDVFMDAVSRKISLDTLVDFALAQGSQWIFITPHDISMVKPGERIKKQQMAAPRG